VVDDSGNVVVAGSSSPAGAWPYQDSYTAKYAASDGALLWEKRFNRSADGSDAGLAVAMDESGNVVVMASSATLKCAAADGALLWERRYTGNRALALDGGGNVLTTGSPGTLKLAAADGALLWLKPFGGERARR
jgi:outer membrane protein assembly factor BamB